MISTIKRTIEAGRVELAALLHFLHRELAHHELVDLAKGVAFEADGVEQFDQLDEDRIRDFLVVFRQRIGQLAVAGLDIRHRVVEGAAEIGALGQIAQMGESRLRRQIDDAARLERVRPRRQP
jgi:hypothetical protein